MHPAALFAMIKKKKKKRKELLYVDYHMPSHLLYSSDSYGQCKSDIHTVPKKGKKTLLVELCRLFRRDETCLHGYYCISAPLRLHRKVVGFIFRL